MFKAIHLRISSPDRSKTAEVELSEILTVSQVLEELTRHGFILPSYTYGLLVEADGRLLTSDLTLQGLGKGGEVRVVILQTPRQNKIHVTILHPTDGTDMEVELYDSLTADEIVDELIACGFIERNEENKAQYQLFIKNSQTTIRGHQILAFGGAVDGSVLSVVSSVMSDYRRQSNLLYSSPPSLEKSNAAKQIPAEGK